MELKILRGVVLKWFLVRVFTTVLIFCSGANAGFKRYVNPRVTEICGRLIVRPELIPRVSRLPPEAIPPPKIRLAGRRYLGVRGDPSLLAEDPNLNVVYFDDAEREAHRVFVANGLLFRSNGEVFQSPHSVAGDQASIFVMDRNGNYYSAEKRFPESRDVLLPVIKHSSFFGHGEIAAAGEWHALTGILEGATNETGHFPKAWNLMDQFVEELRLDGVVLQPKTLR